MRSVAFVAGLLAFGCGGSQKQEPPPHNTTGPAETLTQDPAQKAAEQDAQVAKISKKCQDNPLAKECS